jgi:hypothetical protein
VLWGSGNIDSDPVFFDTSGSDYRLSTGSPCIDAGDNAAIPSSVVVDLDADPRIINGRVDMGAYEYNRLLLPHMRAGNPSPVDGATDVPPRQVFQWSAGDEAHKHDVYLGTDETAVRDATMRCPEYKGTKRLGSEEYQPTDQEHGTTYYWRVDEYNIDATISKGKVWSFTMAAQQPE